MDYRTVFQCTLFRTILSALAPQLALDFLRGAAHWADSRVVGTLSIPRGRAASSALSRHVRQYPFVLADTQWTCSKHGTYHASCMHCRNSGGPIRKGSYKLT
jgi:hypothetical protein